MTYDVIIIGAGAAGLFAAASMGKKTNSLILNNTDKPGKKLLMSGAGQCNFTNTGSIKDFISHYGEKGPIIRKVLYRFSNKALIEYFEDHGIECFPRADGKVFPKSMKSREILDFLLKEAAIKGFELINGVEVREISYEEGEGVYNLSTDIGRIYRGRNLVIATGGLSFPKTGSNGSIIKAIENLGIGIAPMKEALVPVNVDDYPFSQLAGISFRGATVMIGNKEKSGDLLLTHKNFSGPVILDLSRYANPGDLMKIGYLGAVNKNMLFEALKIVREGCGKKAVTALFEVARNMSTGIPRRFIELMCRRGGIDDLMKFGELSNDRLSLMAGLLTEDTYKITGNSGFNVAMCTAGGVLLDEVDLNTFESKKYPGLYLIGELLDVDGDTGGYNVQFAFSSGYICSLSIINKNDHQF